LQRIDVLLTYLRVGKFTNYRRAPVGEVPCQKIGRHWRFRKEAIDRWLEDLPAEASAQAGTHGDTKDGGNE